MMPTIPTMWTPPKEWEGQEAYIIGGGHSLKTFNFERLRGRNVIGCNDAFRLGSGICPYCHFGDASWFTKTSKELEQFAVHGGGKVVTNAPSLFNVRVDWLKHMHRLKLGIGEGNVLGFNFSTGASAINLAILLGATRIFLLGYDLCAEADGNTHWHQYRNRPIHTETYPRFRRGFQAIKNDLVKYPNVSVVNVTDGTSALDVFPKASFADVFREVVA